MRNELLKELKGIVIIELLKNRAGERRMLYFHEIINRS